MLSYGDNSLSFLNFGKSQPLAFFSFPFCFVDICIGGVNLSCKFYTNADIYNFLEVDF